MISSPNLSFPEIPSTMSPTTLHSPEPRSPPSQSSPSSEAPPRRFKKLSPQLNRWSRARAIRSGRKLEHPVGDPSVKTDPDSSGSPAGDESQIVLDSPVKERGSNRDGETELRVGKSIYMLSDGTGWTAEHSVSAALMQFEHCLMDGVCPVDTHLFSGINDVSCLMEIVKQAAKERALVVYTLADPSMAESAKQACALWGVTATDILGPITRTIGSHLGVPPSGLPLWVPGRRSTLSDEYFRRIEAIKFTIKQDDGALPQNLHKADIVLAGVSRTGKTPLSIYLAQKGYKAANVPIVMNVELPKSLFEVEPQKVFCLTVNPVVLQTVRKSRESSLSSGADLRTNYSEMDHVKAELEFAARIFAQNPVWTVVEVTGKAIEETAAIILRLYHDRKNKFPIPRISKQY